MAKTRKKVRQDSPPEDDFGALFQHYLLRRTERLLDQVAADDQLLDEEVRSKALTALEFALESQDAHALAGKLLLAMAPKMERAGFRDEWMNYLKRWLACEAIQKDLACIGELEYQVGFLSQLCADFETAKEYLQKSRGTFASLDNVEGQARALNRLAFVARLQEHPQTAHNYVEIALSILPINSPDREFCYFVLAVLAEDSGNYREAVTYYRQSLDSCKQVNNPSKLALRLGNLGLGLYYIKEYSEAIGCFEQSIHLFSSLNDKARIAGIWLNLGVIYLVTAKTEKAIDLFTKAELVFRSLSDNYSLGLVYLNLGIAHRDMSHYNLSEQFLLTSIQYWEQLGAITDLVNVMDELGLTYLSMNNQSKAIQTFKDSYHILSTNTWISGYSRLENRLQNHIRLAEQGYNK